MSQTVFSQPYAMVGGDVYYVPKPSAYDPAKPVGIRVAKVVEVHGTTAVDLHVTYGYGIPNGGHIECVRHLSDPWHIYNPAQSERLGGWVHIPAELLVKHYGFVFDPAFIVQTMDERIIAAHRKGSSAKMIASMYEASGVTESYVINVLAQKATRIEASEPAPPSEKKPVK